MSAHAIHPHGDGDKTVCGLRISGKPGRVSALTPRDLTCNVCVLRMVRTWQQNCDVDLQAVIDDGRFLAVFPWNDPSYRRDASHERMRR